MGKGLKNKKPFTLQVDEHFFHNRYSDAFSIDHLNESELYDALNTIDLITPQRSTLKDNNDNNNFWPYDSSISLDQTIGQSQSEPKGRDCCGGDGVMSSKDLLVSSFKISHKRRISKRTNRRKRSIVAYGSVDSFNNIAGFADVDSFGTYDGAAAVAGSGAGAGAEDDSSLFVDSYSWEF
ncbi:conserved hypothetical protein [Ricinus communis]|uniref:Uncharacterized protein n=1 Tax=Ricinus communis TaxID=3988 RepID=B9RZQ1_RICCO|nr:conserved hypothetical protein [Ricinus communis]